MASLQVLSRQGDRSEATEFFNMKEIEEQLDKQLISSRVLLNNFKLIEESSRLSSSYQDPFYLPFYYYLGKAIQPKSLLEIGVKIGLTSGCFLKGCQTVERFIGFQKKTKDYFSERLAYSNIYDVTKKTKPKLDFYHGSILDEQFSSKVGLVDLILINDKIPYEEMRQTLDIAWTFLNVNGYLVVDYIDSDNAVRDAFSSFCKVSNREPTIFKTRYGVGLVQK